jgi:hypothetical protein
MDRSEAGETSAVPESIGRMDNDGSRRDPGDRPIFRQQFLPF